MQEILEFVRSDGDSSRWPICKQLEDGERWERLENDNELVTHYLDKVSTQLADLFGRPCNLLPSLCSHPHADLKFQQVQFPLFRMVMRCLSSTL